MTSQRGDRRLATKKKPAAKPADRSSAVPHAIARAPVKPAPSKHAPAAAPLKAATPTIAADVPPPSAKRAQAEKVGLRALVPSAYNAAGENDEFLRTYKIKWLSKLDFKSETSVGSLLVLSFLFLARGRDKEAEDVADALIAHAKTREMSASALEVLASALYLSAWLKAKRGADASVQLTRARAVGKFMTSRDREWLSNEAPQEIADAIARGRLHLLIGPFSGILKYLNDPGARFKAESMLAHGLDAARSLMM
jgi:hypothetical protein